MSKLKRIFSCLLILVMAISLLAGCGGTTADTGAADSGSTAAKQEKTDKKDNKKDEETVTLKYYFLTATTQIQDIPMIEEAVNEYIEPLIGAKIEMNIINVGSYSEQVGLMVRTGEPIDLVFSFQADMLSYVSQGAVQPLDDLLAECGQGIIEVVGQDVLDAIKIDGSLYSIPTLKDQAAGRGFLYNKAIADELGLDFSNVDSVDDLTEIFAYVKENSDYIPFAGGGGNNRLWENWNYDNLGDWLGVLMDRGEEAKVVNLFETDYYMELCKMTREWYLNGYLVSDYATSEDTWGTRMQTGNYLGGINANKPGGDIEMQNSLGYEVGFVELFEEFSMTGFVNNTNWMIPVGSKNPEKAMEFLNLMYTDSYLASLLGNGIEDVHYTRDADGFITTVENSGYVNPYQWAQGNQFITNVYAGNPADIWDQQRTFNQNAKKSIALGFIFDNTNVLDEVTACNNVIAKYRASIDCGSVDPEVAIPEFNKELYAAGLDKIIAEKQAQLDAWLASKE